MEKNIKKSIVFKRAWNEHKIKIKLTKEITNYD